MWVWSSKPSSGTAEPSGWAAHYHAGLASVDLFLFLSRATTHFRPVTSAQCLEEFCPRLAPGCLLGLKQTRQAGRGMPLGLWGQTGLRGQRCGQSHGEGGEANLLGSLRGPSSLA